MIAFHILSLTNKSFYKTSEGVVSFHHSIPVMGVQEHEGNEIKVSKNVSTRFWIELTKRLLKENDQVELSGLGLGESILIVLHFR
jgi:hypothetical protein